jgi:two-component system, OmpR family, osmolarity sensor histidine kinase EnvZ
LPRTYVGLSLFWRTAAFLAVLLLAALMGMGFAVRALDAELHAPATAARISHAISMVRPLLATPDAAAREQHRKALETGGGMRVVPLLPGHATVPNAQDRAARSLTRELRRRLGQDTEVASSVNGQAGLWVGFAVEDQRYWLYTIETKEKAEIPVSWWLWFGLAAAVLVLAAAAVTHHINRPMKELSFAASRVREGVLDSQLDENTLTSEIREVNKGFNRMARELAKVDEDRAVMLAGISHDLRTPLARLRLETEMSVNNEEARRNMAMDIEQLDAIIDKFMDYARPGNARLEPVRLAPLIEREASAFRDPREIRIASNVSPELTVMADDTELGRVFANLFENARRYGRGTYTGVALVSVSAVRNGPWVVVTVRDQGPGVGPEKIAQLTTPFFRGDAARTAATGAGLGLAIVEKSAQRMGGSLELANAPDGGLMAHIRLKRVG